FVYKVEVNSAPTRGPADAMVTIVAFSSFDCEECVRVDKALRALTDDENTGVRLVWKDLPRSDAARLPARAARAAGAQQKFWDMTDRLMGESKGTADQAALLDHAQ